MLATAQVGPFLLYLVLQNSTTISGGGWWHYEPTCSSLTSLKRDCEFVAIYFKPAKHFANSNPLEKNTAIRWSWMLIPRGTRMVGVRWRNCSSSKTKIKLVRVTVSDISGEWSSGSDWTESPDSNHWCTEGEWPVWLAMVAIVSAQGRSCCAWLSSLNNFLVISNDLCYVNALLLHPTSIVCVYLCFFLWCVAALNISVVRWMAALEWRLLRKSYAQQQVCKYTSIG